MFICQQCTKDKYLYFDAWHLWWPQSFGTCEICNRIRDCFVIPDEYSQKSKMKMPKTYILQKDLPDSKAGDKYIFVEELYHLDGDTSKSYWTPDHVENNVEWFKEEQDISMLMVLNGDMITIKDNGVEYVLPVKTLLELVKHRDELHGVEKVWVNPEAGKKYTEQDMKEAFYGGYKRTWTSFLDYLEDKLLANRLKNG